jgi:predicted MFS family arabinose efflux permease
VGQYGPVRLYLALRTIDPSRLRHAVSGRIGRYLGAMTLCAVGFAVFWGPMPAYLEAIGLGTGPIFALFVLANAGSAVCYVPVGRLAGRRSPRDLQAGALAARAAAFPLVGVVGAGALRLPGVALVFLVSGVTWAVIAVAATDRVSRLAAPDRRGEALGVYAALAGAGGGVGSALGGALVAVLGYPLTFAIAGGLVLVGAAVVATDRAPDPTASHLDI